MKHSVIIFLIVLSIVSCKKENNNTQPSSTTQNLAKKITLSDTAGRKVYEFNYDTKARLATVKYFQYMESDTGIGRQFFSYEPDQIVVPDTFNSKSSQYISSRTILTDQNGKLSPFLFKSTYYANGFVKDITYNFFGSGRIEFINDGRNIIKRTELNTDSLGNVIDTFSVTDFTYSKHIVKQHFLHNAYAQYSFDFECGNLDFMIFPGLVGKLNTNYIESVNIYRPNFDAKLYTYIYEADSLGQISKITYSQPYESPKVFHVKFE